MVIPNQGINPAAMAGGGGGMPPPAGPGGGMPPPAMGPGGGMPPPAGGPGAAPGQPPAPGGVEISQVLEILKQVIQQAVDQNGYVDVNRLITLWPQFSQIPFQTVMQLIEQNPEIINDLIVQYGLNGIIANGRVISADELANLGGGGGGTMGQGGV